MKKPEHIEHIIGLLCANDLVCDGLVTLTEIARHAERNKEFYDALVSVDIAKPNQPPFNLSDYANHRRKTDLMRFKFCPVCGQAIDWKEFARLVDEVENAENCIE